MTTRNPYNFMDGDVCAHFQCRIQVKYYDIETIEMNCFHLMKIVLPLSLKPCSIVGKSAGNQMSYIDETKYAYYLG